MTVAGRRSRGRAYKLIVVLGVIGLHCLVLWQVARRVMPPSTKGDGSSRVVALQLALASATILEDPRSQGADEQTQMLVAEPSTALPSDTEMQAQGAGVQPDILPGGSHSDGHVESATAAQDGGGGGTKDDPYARAALPVSPDVSAAFNLAARNDALFLSRVQPCLTTSPAALAGVKVAVTLDGAGMVTKAQPLRLDPAPGAPPPTPTAQEIAAIAAVRACAPYHDIVFGSSPVLKMPDATPAAKLVTTDRHGVQG